MSLSFTSIVYEDNHNCVSWSGLQCADGEHFFGFLANNVSSRLSDSEGNDEFRSHLSGLALTGLGQESLAAVLNAEQPEERSWAAAEALAEAFLEEDHGVVFPWNMERDKRNPFGSLPGADIVGLTGEGPNCRFALGEVKSSSEEKYPPQVMSGRSYNPDEENHAGMGNQIYKLANDLTAICQLIKWLLPRVKGTDHEPNYDQAAITFFNSGNKDIALFGILIRDTQAEEKDLSLPGAAFRRDFSNPTTCQLTALYLPWGINKLIDKIRNGGAS
jgi:hypothetical protein